MKKTKLFVCMALILTSLCGISGCSKTPDTKEVFEKTAEAMRKVKSVSADLEMNMDMNMAAGEDASFTMKMKADGDMKLAMKDSFSMAMNLKLNASVLGQKQENEMQMYIVQEGDNLIQYSGDGETWTKTVTPFDTELLNTINGEDSFYDMLAENTDIIEYVGTKEIKGKDAYEYTVTYDKKVFDKLMSSEEKKALETQLEELKDIFDLDKLKFKVSMFIYKDDYTIAKVSIDLGKALDKVINQAMKAAGTDLGNMKVSMKKLDMSITFHKYNKMKEVKVPEEVKDNAVEEEPAFNMDSIEGLGSNADGTRTLQHFLDAGFSVAEGEDINEMIEPYGYAFFTVTRGEEELFVTVMNMNEENTVAKNCEVSSAEDYSEFE